MSRKKVCIITQSHLCRNPRVLKEALALSAEGYRVVILNSTYSSELHAEDISLIKNTDIELIAVASLQKNGFATIVHRLLKKLGDTMVKKLGLQSHMAFGYASGQYKKTALKQNADLYIGHQELGLYCGVELLKVHKKVAFDFEDWYSEDLLDTARSYRPIKLLQKLEETALKNGTFCLAPSDTMASKLAQTYNSNKPFVIYNTFDLDEKIISGPKTFDSPVKLFWFSQTIGPGRGLEQFFELLNNINVKLQIHLLGNVSNEYQNELIALLQSPHKVYFHSLVPADDLAAKIAEFDVGLALELTRPQNRNVTITNKFFQYTLSGLPVISTPTLGQVEIFNKDTPGFLLDNLDNIASPGPIKQLEAWLQNKQQLQTARNNAIKFARQYCWQNESSKLIKLVNDVKM